MTNETRATIMLHIGEDVISGDRIMGSMGSWFAVIYLGGSSTHLILRSRASIEQLQVALKLADEQLAAAQDEDRIEAEATAGDGNATEQ